MSGGKPTAEALKLHVDDLSSDDEVDRNTIGNVPLEWYDGEDHIGYDHSGSKIIKSKKKDGIDKFLASQEDPNYRWTVRDELNDEDVVLSRREVEIIRQIHSGRYPHPEFNAFPDYIPYYTSEREIHPLIDAPEPKRRFLPSKWEKMKIMRLVRLIKEGKIKKEPVAKPQDLYLLWGDDDNAVGFEPKKKAPPRISAPKMPLPGHAASYNPPAEYLMTEAEEKRWQEMHPEDRPVSFVPRKYPNLRSVPGYPEFIRERFDRCLDMYLCPRAVKKRLNVDPETLLPTLPDPKELRPFPTSLTLQYLGHTGRVRSLAVDPTGQWLATGSDDKTVRIWEVCSGRQFSVLTMDSVVFTIAWNPNPALHVLAVCVANRVVFVSTGTCGPKHAEATFAFLSAAGQKGADRKRRVVSGEDGSTTQVAPEDAATQKLVTWDWLCTEDVSTPESLRGAALPVLAVQHPAAVKRISWHRKGDYISTVSPTASTAHVLIHQVSRRRSQCPWKRARGIPQCVAFHPTKPILFLANQRVIRMYNLVEGGLIKKLRTGLMYISSIDIHPSGDHVIVGSYDSRVVWMDSELSATPFKTLRYHEKAVRKVCFHPQYPLMASSSDDGKVHIFHARVFDEYDQNPIIVPVKILKAHKVTKDDLGALDCLFHPTQPWIFTAGADGAVNLFQSIP